MRKNPVIINQVGAEFGAAVAAHSSEPRVIDQIRPERPWEIPDEAEILVTNVPAWRQTPAHFLPPSGLRWVHTETTGVDFYPDSLKRHCLMTCGRGTHAVPIAEFVFAALLRREKKLEETRALKASDWIRPEIGTLNGRKLGLIGFGSLGQAVATRAIAFGMQVYASRRSRWTEVPAGVVPCDRPEDVVSAVDHLVVAAPLTDETAGMIDAAFLSLAKPHLHVINISRGALINQEALLEALDDDRLGYATLDVTSPEPLPDGHPLYSHPRVFISPHISWRGGGTGDHFLQRFLDNLDAYLENRPLKHAVDPLRGY